MPPQEDHVLDLVDAYLHEALPGNTMDYVRQHCQECPICRVALDEARRRLAAMQSLPPCEPSEELIRSTLDCVERYRRRRRKVVVWGWSTAASVLVILGALHLYVATLAPSPWDLRLLGQSEWTAGSPASLRVVLVDRRTQQGVSGAEVEVDLAGPGPEPPLRLARFTTDRCGSSDPRFRLPDAVGDYEIRARARWGQHEESVQCRVKLKRSWQLMLTSDKPVYQPGQTIRLRGLALARPELRPVAGREAVFSIADPRGNTIFRTREVTSRYGIVWADCPLAEEILEGSYRIRCELGDTTSEATVEVKRYVLPKFKIDVELDRSFYEPGQRAVATVRTAYFFGKPLAGATVELSVGFEADQWVPGSRRTATTDEQGLARIEFPVPDKLVGRPQDSGDARLSIGVLVHDSAGQEQRRTVWRTVSSQPIHIEVIPESGRLVPGVSNRVYFFTTYPDGQTARTRVAISGFNQELEANAFGVSVLEFRPDEGRCSWTIRATDASGITGRRQVELSADRVSGDFLVRTDKAVYDGGQTLHVLVLGSGIEPVYLDLIRDGQTLLTQAVDVVDGRGEQEIDLAPDLGGTLQLCAYRYGEQGFPVRKTRTLYVRPAQALRVSADLDRTSYRPGQRARLSFRVTDPQGRPAPGALSLAAVDEAVYSVLAQRPGSEQAFFLHEQKLLEPVYAVYGWSPDLRSDAKDRDLLELALFSRSATTADRGIVLEELVRRYCDGNMDLLRVLQRPDWERIAEGMQLPAELRDLLRGSRSSHTLSGASYSQKVRSMNETQARISNWIVTGWILVGITILCLIAVFLSHRRMLWEILAIGLILFILIGMLMPASTHVRERARPSVAASHLYQLGVAFESAKANQDSAVFPHEPHAATARPRLRQWFPETLLWRPELITDDQGHAELDVDLADSITTWRLSAGAVSAEGKLGAVQQAIRVFQPFFVDLDLPAALVRNDEIELPAVVYNYTDAPIRVTLDLNQAEWFKCLGPAHTTVELGPSEVRSAHFRIQAVRAGAQPLRLEAHSGELSDAIVRPVEVRADGQAVQRVFNGELASHDTPRPTEIRCHVPDTIIEGSLRAGLKLYPSRFSQLVEGLDAIFQRPYGCFEQTSSTTYPNVLALQYLRSTGQTVPGVETKSRSQNRHRQVVRPGRMGVPTSSETDAKAREYIHLGYQRLLGFEVPGGGFDWFGRAPAHTTLTAYGLMEFNDMARVVDVDSALIDRTRRWLLGQQQPNGTWLPGGSGQAILSATAYVAWSVFDGQPAGEASRRTRDFLAAERPGDCRDPYTMALTVKALAAVASDEPALRRPWLDRLRAARRTSADGKQSWWGDAETGCTLFYGSGRARQVETTALAVLALLPDGADPAACRQALTWLIAQKDASGLWPSTQASILALKALVAGTGKALGETEAKHLEVILDGKTVRDLHIPADQSDVMQQVDLAPLLSAGDHTLELRDRSDHGAAYQFVLEYHVPEDRSAAAAKPDAAAKAGGPLAIDVTYDRTDLAVGESLAVRAVVRNRTDGPIPMAIVDLPIPAGFGLDREHLDRSAKEAGVAKVQVTTRALIVYLREIPAQGRVTIDFRLQALMPVKATAVPGQVYEYYNPDRSAQSPAAELRVRAP